ncbi:MAG: hypothetical protein PHQ23_01550 [Candidatus Wallbacteria bacterium]|nr:hypothetical protein [Candidatus Wallbacteria bacterium]
MMINFRNLTLPFLMVLVCFTAQAHIGYQVVVDPSADPVVTLLTLNVAIDPADSGTVSKAPDKPTYKKGESVVLSATPKSGYAFDRWDGSVTSAASQITLKMDGHKSVKAIFKTSGPGPDPDPDTYTLNIEVSPAGSGTVEKKPNLTQFASGAQVELTAKPSADYTFDKWSGDGSGTSNPLTVTMNSNKSVKAEFKASGPGPGPDPIDNTDEIKIFFETNRDTKYAIYRADFDGANQVLVSPQGIDSKSHALSVSGSSIAMVCTPGTTPELTIMNLDGSGKKKLSDHKYPPQTVLLTPDGTKVVYTERQAPPPGGGIIPDKYDIFVIGADGSGKITLASGDNDDNQPCISPDGSRVAFASLTDKDTGDVFIVGINGNGSMNLTDDNKSFSPCFSPDGSKIAFSSKADGTGKIYLVSPSGGTKTKIAEKSGINCLSPRFSSDGTKVIFIEEKKSGIMATYDLGVVNADGTGQKTLTQNMKIKNFSTGPKAGLISFDSNHEGNYEIYQIRDDGSGQIKLTTNAKTDWRPLWKEVKDSPAPPPVASKTFRIIASGDYNGDGDYDDATNNPCDLSNDDADVVKTELTNLSWQCEKDVRDQNITINDFIPASPVTLLYYTGHGAEEGLMFAAAGGIGAFRPTDYTGNNLKHFVFAACSAVTNAWIAVDSGSSTLKSILGYREPTWDDDDNQLARDFIGRVKDLSVDDGTGYMDAWRQTNLTFPNGKYANLWSAVTGGEYFYGSGSKEVFVDTGFGYKSAADVISGMMSGVFYRGSRINGSKQLSGRIRLAFRAVDKFRSGGFPEIQAYAASGKQAVSTGRTSSGFSYRTYPSGGRQIWRPSRNQPMAVGLEHAFGAVLSFVEKYGGLPADAELRGIVPVMKVSSSGAEVIVSYLFSFARVRDGMVFAGRTGDCLDVVVDDDGVVAFSRLWRELEYGSSCKSSTVDPVQALYMASNELSRRFKGTGPVTIVNYAMGYYAPSREEGGAVEMVPCYHFFCANGWFFQVHALTGQLLIH